MKLKTNQDGTTYEDWGNYLEADDVQSLPCPPDNWLITAYVENRRWFWLNERQQWEPEGGDPVLCGAEVQDDLISDDDDFVIHDPHFATSVSMRTGKAVRFMYKGKAFMVVEVPEWGKVGALREDI